MCSEPDGSLCDLDLANVMYVENLITVFGFMWGQKEYKIFGHKVTEDATFC